MLTHLYSTTRKQEQGFTLVELIVVIIIIGILASIAIPFFYHQRQKANDIAVKSDMRNAATTIESLFTKKPNGTISAASVNSKHPAQVAVGEFSAPLTVTDGVNMNVRPQEKPTTFVIEGWHDNGSKYTEEHALVYDSITGGFLSETVSVDVPGDNDGELPGPGDPGTEPTNPGGDDNSDGDEPGSPVDPGEETPGDGDGDGTGDGSDEEEPVEEDFGPEPSNADEMVMYDAKRYVSKLRSTISGYGAPVVPSVNVREGTVVKSGSGNIYRITSQFKKVTGGSIAGTLTYEEFHDGVRARLLRAINDDKKAEPNEFRLEVWHISSDKYPSYAPLTYDSRTDEYYDSDNLPPAPDPGPETPDEKSLYDAKKYASALSAEMAKAEFGAVPGSATKEGEVIKTGGGNVYRITLPMKRADNGKTLTTFIYQDFHDGVRMRVSRVIGDDGKVAANQFMLEVWHVDGDEYTASNPAVYESRLGSFSQ